ncbi:MAG: HAMP domain-containing histidine kinase [Oligoflexia bacterium]|nr:HAMP domain-containing histidine kinase [Oligoflexia bacterium]
MKRKFFLTSLAFIVFIVVTTLLVSGLYFAKERRRLLDQQIEGIVSGLLANGLKDAELTEMDEIVASALFDHPRTILLNVYDTNHKLIYQNVNSQNILGDDLPSSKERLKEKLFTFESDGHKVRFLNFILSTKKVLQVGLLLDQQLSHLWEMNQRILFLLVIIMLLTTAVAWMLAKILVRPLEEITSYVHTLAINIERNSSVRPPLSQKLQSMTSGRNKNEIQILWDSLNYFRSAVETKINLTRATVTQMAHELKTPLTIIRNSLEYLQIKKITSELSEQKLIVDAIEETDRLSATIGSFLDWSRFESFDKKADIHALRCTSVVESVLLSVSKAFPAHSYQWNFSYDIQLFANPEDLRQLISNLVDNAFKYSIDKSIGILLKDNKLTIENCSLPVPEIVFQRLGEPFNTGKISGARSGNGGIEGSIGLGLAWVCSICNRYNWSFEFSHVEGKTVAMVSFASSLID